MNTTDIDLTPFCSTSDSRYAFKESFVRNGWRYATDGRILIRIPADEPDTPAQEGTQFPPVEPLFTDVPDGAWRPWPLDDLFDVRECTECKGLGEVDCPTCGQDTECKNCSGRGRFDGYQKIDRCKVKGQYVKLILALSNPQFYKVADNKPIRFKFDGGDGAVMPVD